MFPTFISILDIQSWWEVPSIAHFCSLFRSAFNLLDFDIEDLEEALLTDGTEETSWLQELIVRLLSGCLPNNEISTFNYQMFLRRLFRQKCQEHDQYNPFNTDVDFQILPLRTKVDILHALCDFRLDAEDVLDQLKNLEADSLRVEPLGYDSNESAYWYFYGTRLYREDFKTKNNKKQSIWQVICFTEDDWFQLTKKFKKSTSKPERQLYTTLSENFLPELPRLFKEKERLARKRLLENQPRRTSSRIRKSELTGEKDQEDDFVVREVVKEKTAEEEEQIRKRELEIKRREAYERRNKLKEREASEAESISEESESRYEMAKSKGKKSKSKQVAKSPKESPSNKDSHAAKGSKKNKKKGEKPTTKTDKVSKAEKRSSKSERVNSKEEKVILKETSVSTTTKVGRQTNNSLAAATGQIVIEPMVNPHRKKLKTSQVFRQTDEDLQTGMHKILDHIKNHEDAWPFADPVEEEYAPNYYSVIRKPMDLQRMEERLDSGYYKSFSKFRSDFQLIVDNCRLYNGAENEYTEMVDNLLKAFERATEKYLDQITSSEDEIAVEYPIDDSENDSKQNKPDKVEKHAKKRKPTLAAKTDKKRDRSPSEGSLSSARSDSFESIENLPEEKPAKKNKSSKKTKNKASKVSGKKVKHESKKQKEKEPKEKHHEDKNVKVEKVKKPKKVAKSKKKPLKKMKTPSPVRSRSGSRTRSRSVSQTKYSSSPPLSWPPSSPEYGGYNFSQEKKAPKRKSPDRTLEEQEEEDEIIKKKKLKEKQKEDKWKELFENEEINNRINSKIDKVEEFSSLPSPKPKDKHNKLRETIEKLKAKSEISHKLSDFEFSFDEFDKPKENLEKNKIQKEEKSRSRSKEKSHKHSKKDVEIDDGNNTMDSVHSENRKFGKKCSKTNNAKNSNMEALSLATEQTLKDINKWLDDTPKFAEFSSASNSPSYTGLDDFDTLTGKTDPEPPKKVEKTGIKKEGNKDIKRRTFSRDPAKFLKRREVQRTIDRLQPGKSKGNLISNVQSANKVDEMFPLGPLSKLKDTKNALIVKTDENAPKLSLGSVLDSFGKHKFIDDQKKEEPVELPKEEDPPLFVLKNADDNKKEEPSNLIEDKETITKVAAPAEEPTAVTAGSATPNLSAWFKAFGAPKVQPPAKKSELKNDGKEEEKDSKDTRKIPIPEPSPNPDSPVMVHGQPVPRQRKISTGSSMSERSSFSQDMDSPRVGIDERLGAYPAPYPSPLHRSPSGASPVMASPRPDVSPKAAYPAFNGQIRVGFYQDTVSTKSSPDKSCSPKDNPLSPHPQYSEHVYTPNTTQQINYSYANSYYTHAPNYSNTIPTPPSTQESSMPSYYDTNKSLIDQYQAKTSSHHGYLDNSPASNVSSPASLPQHSPNVLSPNVHSPAVQSPNVQSPSMHSPSMHSPSMHSPKMHSPNVHSPNMHSPNMHSPSVQHLPQVRSPIGEAPVPVEEQKIEKPTPVVPSAVFPVKKRAYMESESHNLNMEVANNRYGSQQEMQDSIKLQETVDKTLDSKITENSNKPSVKQYSEQIIPEVKPPQVNDEKSGTLPNTAAPQQITMPQQNQSETTRGMQQYVQHPSSFANTYSEASYPLNIPSTRTLTQQEIDRKLDMSKYTNMGYTGPDVNFTRNMQQFTRPDYSRSSTNTPTSQTQQPPPSVCTSQSIQTSAANVRYTNPNASLPMSYKGLDMNTNAAISQAHNFNQAHQNNRPTTENVGGNYKSDVSIPRPTYNTPTIDIEQPLGLRGNIANLSHIVDRYNTEERMLSGLQVSSPYYSDKGLPTSHMFNKPISTSASALPMFSQANMAITSYNQNMQANTAPVYNRQISELQTSVSTSNEHKASSNQPAQEKKSKKRKAAKTATPANTVDQQTNSQGFQSYAGLKNSSTVEPSAISLKTTSVVPGSAFNFGPTASGLGIGTGLYGDKDAYPNFLDDFRATPNYYMAAAAAAHHRSTPESTEKQSRMAAHQSSTSQAASGYPFITAPQGRPQSYPLGNPFINPAQAQLMDASSPLYQHYLQAGVLNQGLLGPPGAYPPGYHPALSMRQPYDSMTRPSWL